MILGTVQYMAPEQLEGKPADARTDIFAFGAVLYEMATQRQAFDGTRPLTPSSLDAVVVKCLERDPANRWGSCRELLAELRRLADGPSATERAPRALSRPRRLALAAVSLLLLAGIASVRQSRATVPESVAVLPFSNTTGNAELDYLSDGITDELTNSLSQIPGLRVAPRTLVARYHGADIESVGRSLGVQAVVTGRITQSDDAVIVAIELVDIRELSQLWGAQYRSSLLGVMDVERTIAVELAGRLQQGSSRPEPSDVTRQVRPCPHGLSGAPQGPLLPEVADGTRVSGRSAFRARGSDGSFVCAGVRGSRGSVCHPGLFQRAPVERGVSESEGGGAARAPARRPARGGTLCARGSANAVRVELPGRRAAVQSRDRPQPDGAGARHGVQHLSRVPGAAAEGIAEAIRAEQLDPVAPRTTLHTGWVYYFDRQYDRAIEQVRKTLELDPNFPQTFELLAGALLAMRQGADELREIARRYSPDPASFRDAVAYLEAVHGDERVKEAFLKALYRPTEEPQASWLTMASLYVGLGRHSEALDLLEKSYAAREGPLVWLNVTPKFDPLRTDARFVDLVRRIGLQR